MTVSTFPTRGASNPDTRTGGREDLLLDLQAQITALAVGSATADTFFSVYSNSSAVNVTPADIYYTMSQTMTTSGKSLTLPDVTAAASAFAGARISITNPAAATYAYEVKANGGTTLAALSPGETLLMELMSVGSAAGTWLVHKIYDVFYGVFGATLDTVDEPEYIQIPYDYEIVEAYSYGDGNTGSWVADVWKDTAANFPPTNADTITASAPITASSAKRSSDTTLTGWTLTGSAGDFLAFNLDSLSGSSKVTAGVRVKRV